MKSITWKFVLILVYVQASEIGTNVEYMPCNNVLVLRSPQPVEFLLKRVSRQDDMGPFWANRGKKDPKYSTSSLFVDEPHWLLVRRHVDYLDPEFDPYFTTRGKKGVISKDVLRVLLRELNLRKQTTQPNPSKPTQKTNN